MSRLIVAADSSLFDAVAASYEASLNKGLRLSGERPDYFAQRRIQWTAKLLRAERITNVLDFGCGIGLAAPRIVERFQPETMWGFDPSRAAIEQARRDHGGGRFRFTTEEADLPAGEFDLVYCNGVFHHIDPANRMAALDIVLRSLRSGGWLALWENNPWNPGTRWVMRRIPFDRDAVTLSPIEARRMLQGAGFRVFRTDAWFLFPRALRWLRPLESLLYRLPLGGQFMVLAQKSTTSELP